MLMLLSMRLNLFARPAAAAPVAVQWTSDRVLSVEGPSAHARDAHPILPHPPYFQLMNTAWYLSAGHKDRSTQHAVYTVCRHYHLAALLSLSALH